MRNSPVLEQLISEQNRADLKRIELFTRRQIGSDTLGSYKSAFRGSGLIFADLREYQPGDDVKHIHWKATARANRPYVKTYHEDRELRVLLAIDISASTLVGAPRSRHQRALEFAALMSLLAQKSGDQIGLCMFSDKIHSYFSPSAKPSQFQRILLSLLSAPKAGSTTDLNLAFEHVFKYERKPCLLFVLSDFLAPDYSKNLRNLAIKHDLIGVFLSDSLDSELPDCGLVQYRDPESGKQGLFDTSSRSGRQKLLQLHQLRVKKLQESLHSAGADYLPLSQKPLRDLANLMSRRVRMQR